MTRFFFVVVNNHDRERFQVFKKNVKKQVSSIDWGLPKSTNQDLWKLIKKNDIVFFSEKNSTTSIKGNIIGKKLDQKLGEKLWPKNPRLKTIIHFLKLDNLSESSFGFYQLTKFCNLPPTFDVFSNIYEINQQYLETTKSKTSDSQRTQKLIQKPVLIPIDFDGAPKKIQEKIIRFIRDTKKSLLLKKKYNHHCQVCGYRIEISKNKFYSEVHHIVPLKFGGDDNFNNMIVVCPTHHAEFDYNVIGISEDGQTLFNNHGKTMGKLFLQSDHQLNMSKIQEHMKGIN